MYYEYSIPKDRKFHLSRLGEEIPDSFLGLKELPIGEGILHYYGTKGIKGCYIPNGVSNNTAVDIIKKNITVATSLEVVFD